MKIIQLSNLKTGKNFLLNLEIMSVICFTTPMIPIKKLSLLWKAIILNKITINQRLKDNTKVVQLTSILQNPIKLEDINSEIILMEEMEIIPNSLTVVDYKLINNLILILLPNNLSLKHFNINLNIKVHLLSITEMG
jgi:hypothetical protein